MGNNSTSSSVNQCDISTNHSVGGGPVLGGFEGFSISIFMSSLTDMMDECHVDTGRMSWFGVKLFILLMAFPANVGLMWMLLDRKRVMTPSEVLGFNVSIMDILYCLCLPLDLHATLHETSETVHRVREALFALNIFGCPLLLTFMCLERYMAAAWPVAYIKLGCWVYRMVLCSCAWVLTLAMGLMEYFFGVFTMALYLSITISVLFLVMLLCLLGIVWVLCQSGPGQGSGLNVPLKRRALKNIVAVVAPSAVAYSPVVALIPYVVVITLDPSQTISPAQCSVLNFLLVFPNFGLFIGPMFYLTRFRQLTCWTKHKQTPNSRTHVE
ncbi:Proteinase-activated receptor 3 [Nibea albiflora]|uniref:Proteinase-activated receptor 3 n=1 Tax=Nibea albiflora TaxID=240163 RepID=A0ACB7FG50_NIBAL|nr:Proteinase-activated receptor 3 [Nibea albiflora]